MDLQWTPNEGCSCIVTSAKLHYTLSLRPQPYVKGGKIGDIATFDSWPESARGRIRDFRGGVWKTQVATCKS